MKQNKLDLIKYIKDRNGDKIEMKTTSLNLELRQLEFLKAHNLNLSLLVRDFLNDLIKITDEINTTRRPK